MEYQIGSKAFQVFCENLQSTQSPEDILMAVEEVTGVPIKELSEEDLEIQISVIARRVIVWQP